jgi:hypothetical protein
MIIPNNKQNEHSFFSFFPTWYFITPRGRC